MSEEGPQPRDGRGHLVGFLALGAVVALVAIFLVTSHNANEAPFTPLQIHPKLVGLQVLTPSDAEGSNITAALRALGGSPNNNIEYPRGHRSWQYVVGRVDVDQTAVHDASYEVIVVDNRLHRVVPHTFSYPKPRQTAFSGWSEAAGSLHERYDWTPSGEDQAAGFTVGSSTSLPFFARLPAATLPVTRPGTDLTVVLALTHGSSHVYWAIKLN